MGDIYWWLRHRGHLQPDPDIRLWTDEKGSTVGLVWMDPPSSSDVLVRPDHRGSGIESEILHWMEERVLSSGKQEDQFQTFELGGHGDSQWESHIEGQGYALQDTSMIHFWRSLDDVPATIPPAGFQVRGSSGETDAFARDAALGHSFSRSDSRLEMYLNAMRTPGFRKDLDLAVVSDSGEHVAMCMIWLDSDNKVGEFEPVGCQPDYRRKGLSRAMIAEGLRRLKALGAESTVVYPWSTNEPAIRLYESCGFRELFRDRTYTKTLTAS
jgi:ribosomal protein S18 acetylase RimI-like enzyme